MKRFLAALLVVMLLTVTAGLAAGQSYRQIKNWQNYDDPNLSGWYYELGASPKNTPYSYLYTAPSSTTGRVITKIVDYEPVYVHFLVDGKGFLLSGTGSWQYGWVYVTYNGQKGWIHAENVVYNDYTSGGGTIEPTYGMSYTLFDWQNYEDTGVSGWYYELGRRPANTRYSYLYTEPNSTTGRVITRINDYEWVYVYFIVDGKGFLIDGSGSWDWCWVYVEYNGQKGWIRADNVQ